MTASLSRRQSIAVFLSAGSEISPFFLEAAEAFGERMAALGATVIYGGANVGAMGRLANGVLKGQGRLVGVIPDLDFAKGLVQWGLHEKIVVSTLSERKRLMLERADAVVVLPGGLGTLDEITDALVLKQTGERSFPIHFLNLLDFWTPFFELLEVMQEARMIHGCLEGLYQSHCSVDDLVSALGADGVEEQ